MSSAVNTSTLGRFDFTAPVPGLRGLVVRGADGGFTVTETSEIGPIVQQTTTVTLSDRLAPLRVEQTGTVQGMATKVDVTYANGKATGSAATPGPAGIEQKTVDADVQIGPSRTNRSSTTVTPPPWPEGP